MEAIISMLLPYVLPAVGTALAGLITKGAMLLLAKLAAKTEDQHKKELLSAVADLSEKAILKVEQTFVDEMKKQGKWNADAGVEASKLALVELKALVVPLLPGFAKLGIDIGEDYLKTLLEAALKKVT